jgi:signal transduction histidine kinase
MIFSVHSFGPVIPIADRERIFDRYYRSSTTPTAPPAPESAFRWPSASR